LILDISLEKEGQPMALIKKFPAEKIVPEEGTLTGIISWDSAREIEPSLKHSIEIKLAPFILEDKSWETWVRLNSIEFKVRSWRALSAQSYQFPNIIKYLYADGQKYPQHDINGSIQLLGDYHRVGVSQIDFGEIQDFQITVRIKARIDFRDAAAVYGSPEIVLETTLAVAPVEIRGDMAKKGYPDRMEARILAERFLNLDDYGEPVGEVCIKFPPKKFR
jgi:hypothetical protein